MKKNNNNSYDLPEGFESILEMLGKPTNKNVWEENPVALGSLKKLIEFGYGKTQCSNALEKMNFKISRYESEKKWKELVNEFAN